MKCTRKIICLLLLCALCFRPFCRSLADNAEIWEKAYKYCESELGYSRDDLEQDDLTRFDDGTWGFYFVVKDAPEMTDGRVSGILDTDGSLVSINGLSNLPAWEWLNGQIGKCLFSYQEIYALKKEWESKLDSFSESDMEYINSMQDFNPILDFLRLDIVLPDEKCIPYEEARQKAVGIIEAMDGWTPEKTEHIDIKAEVVYIPSGMDHPVYQFIYSTASHVHHFKSAYGLEPYMETQQMMDEEDKVFGGNKNLPFHLSIRIDAYTGEQVGETFLDTPPVCGLTEAGIILWK